MGSDCSSRCLRMTAPIFQSTLPGWGATGYVLKHRKSKQFQSTLPGWGATRRTGRCHHVGSDFNPRSPDGERRFAVPVLHVSVKISIHAPRMGSDRENGHLRPRYGQNHPFSTLIVSQIVVDVLGTVRKSQKHQRTSHYEVIKQPERQK